MAYPGVRYSASQKHVHISDAIGAEFVRLHTASATTQELRQYMNAAGPLLIGPSADEPKPGLYNDAIITQMVTDFGL